MREKKLQPDRIFPLEGFNEQQINEYLSKKLARTGYGGMKIMRTPLGTQITIYAERPGMIIGKSGRIIKKLTEDLKDIFQQFENPQIEVKEVEKPELNAQIMANRIARALERGWHFRRAGFFALQQIMDAGALGCEITIAGKLTGPRSRMEKFEKGYIMHSGHPCEEYVDVGIAVAKRKEGVIGIKVRIAPPNIRLPDDFKIKEDKLKEEVEGKGGDTPGEGNKEDERGGDEGEAEGASE